MRVEGPDGQSDHDLVDYMLPQEVGQARKISHCLVAGGFKVVHSSPGFVYKTNDPVTEVRFESDFPGEVHCPGVGADNQHVAQVPAVCSNPLQKISQCDPAENTRHACGSPEGEQEG